MIKLTPKPQYDIQGEDFFGKVEQCRGSWAGWSMTVDISPSVASCTFYGVKTEEDINRLASAAKMVLRELDSKKPVE